VVGVGTRTPARSPNGDSSGSGGGSGSAIRGCVTRSASA
jgi:hypothetical protein